MGQHSFNYLSYLFRYLERSLVYLPVLVIFLIVFYQNALFFRHLNNVEDDYKSACEELFHMSSIFIGFVGAEDNGDGNIFRSMILSVVHQPKQCIFVCDNETTPSLEDVALQAGKHRVVCGGVHLKVEELVETCVSALADVCNLFIAKHSEQWDLERTREMDNSCCNAERDFPRWNILDMQRQQCIQDAVYTGGGGLCDAEGIADEVETLEEYVRQDGPVQPLLLTGKPGCGKSFLLAHWLHRMRNTPRESNICFLYHVASISCPDSCSVSHLLRRFISLLVDRIPIAIDPTQLEKEFPKYLEQACNNYSGGVVVVIDGADCIANIGQLKWLLDPLPFSVRVVVAVSSERFPEKWKSWPYLHLSHEGAGLWDLLQSKNREIIHAKHNQTIAGSIDDLFEEVRKTQ